MFIILTIDPVLFLDEASVLANWLFGLIILGMYTHNTFNFRNTKFSLLLFSMFFAISSLIIVYLFVIFMMSRYRVSMKFLYITLFYHTISFNFI